MADALSDIKPKDSTIKKYLLEECQLNIVTIFDGLSTSEKKS